MEKEHEGVWNHRLIRHVNLDGEEWYGIHEVYYDGIGEPPHSCTSEPVEMIGFTVGEVREKLRMMQRCLEHPVIDYNYFIELQEGSEGAS